MSKRPEKYTGIMALVEKRVTAGRYYDTRHATDRKSERDISLMEILRVFKNGFHEKRRMSLSPSLIHGTMLSGERRSMGGL